MTKGHDRSLAREIQELIWRLKPDNVRRPGRQPKAAERKKLARQARRILRGTKPVDIEAATEKKYRDSLRFVDSMFASAREARCNTDFLKNVPPGRRKRYMVKPWRGRAGRAAAKSAGTTTKRKDQKKTLAIELRAKGHTEVEIAKMIGRTERTVRRYLNGH